MFVKALFIVVKKWKLLHHPKINYNEFKQRNTMQPLKILLQQNLMTWGCSAKLKNKMRKSAIIKIVIKI